MKNFQGKNIVITGGNRGIGKATALAFAELGANVFISSHSDQSLAEQVVQELRQHGVKAQQFKMDISNKVDRAAFVEACYAQGDIDVLVNNAGIATRNPFLKLSEQEVRHVMEVNFMAPLFLMQDFARHMATQQQKLTNQKHPLKDYSIINITSICETVSLTSLCHYEASKAALQRLTKSAALDLAKYKIRVNCLAPGIVATDINRDTRENNPARWQKRVLGTPLGRTGNPEEIASAAVFLASNTWATGTDLVVDGGRSVNWEGESISHDMFAD